MSNQQDEYWQAVVERNPGFDGVFFYGVLTTGVYCRPSCNARSPLRKNVRFYPTAESAKEAGLRPCKRCNPNQQQRFQGDLMYTMRKYIEDNYQHPLTLQHLAKQAGMSISHFQRSFKAAVGMSPKKYQEACRIKQFKNALQSGENVTTAMHNSGYESSSRLYEKLDSHMGMTPNRYRKGGAGERISYAAGTTELGTVMIGATDRGICFLQFGEEEKGLLAQLNKEYPNADVMPMSNSQRPLFKQWMTHLNNFFRGKNLHMELPLDIHGTAFQRLVWEYLISIPSGELQSYTDVAKGIGKPAAVRAVASACANNKVAIIIPCHRVIRGDGNLAGYKWGLARKRTLIDLERRHTLSSDD